MVANVLPANATNKTVTWSITGGTDIASISSTGLVTANNNGKVTVTAIANDGSGIYGTFAITISNNNTAYENLLVKVYPNPAREFVTIMIDESTIVPDFIQLIELSGIIALRFKVDPDIREYTIPLNLKNGVYIVQLGTGYLTQFTQKLIVGK